MRIDLIDDPLACPAQRLDGIVRDTEHARRRASQGDDADDDQSKLFANAEENDDAN